MKAVTTHQGTLSVVDIPDPRPGKGQVLLEVVRTGICGSDLHARVHADVQAEDARTVGYDDFMRVADEVVMGHELLGRVISYGPKTRKAWKPGTRVVAMPILTVDGTTHLTGLTPKAPGGYAELVLAEESLTFEVPDTVPDDMAVLTEPLSVANHAVRRARISKADPAVVIGCGPIGLAVILMLKARGVKKVVASDLSPGRRDLARACGADVVVDPRISSPYDAIGKHRGVITTLPDLLGLAVGSMKALRAVPLLPWGTLMRTADRLGQTPRGPVVFECVGVPGMIDRVISETPLRTRVVVVGVCMEPDTFHPSMAITKELELVFTIYYDPAEYAESLAMIADGRIDPRPLHTGTVGLDGVAGAFEALAHPEVHAKILIDPHRPGSGVVEV
ncbi:MAG: zinc-binding dehydrogenase [Nocardioides sp.]